MYRICESLCYFAIDSAVLLLLPLEVLVILSFFADIFTTLFRLSKCTLQKHRVPREQLLLQYWILTGTYVSYLRLLLRYSTNCLRF